MSYKQIIIKYYKGEPISGDEAYNTIKDYMEDIGKPNPNLLNELFIGFNPFYPELIKQALNVSIIYFEKKEEINKLLDKNGKLIMIL